MSEPFIFIATHKLKEGRLEAAKQMCAWLVEFVESNEPRILGFNCYLNEEGTEVSIVQVHPDADSMQFHMQLLSEHITDSYEEEGPLDVTISIQLYGAPSETVLDMIRNFSPGLPLIVKPLPLGGFIRSAPGQTSASAAA